MGDHAKLSASGAARWMACPPSASLESQFGYTISEYAEEGTFAHAVAETMLQKELKKMSTRAANKILKAYEDSKYYSAELMGYAQGYADWIMETVNTLPKDAQIMLEQRLDFSSWVPEGFGTGDVVMVYDDTIEVVDLKYGKGVAVSAENNPQMRLYALGAYALFDGIYDIEKVRMTIAQPRLDSISTEEISLEELLAWAETEVAPKAQLAIEGEGEYFSGDHCKFCKAKAVCRARADANLELAMYDFADGDTLSLEEVGTILHKAKELEAWAKDIKAYAEDQAINHEVEIPGWKVVAGKSNRAITDEEAAKAACKEAGYSQDRYINLKLRGITELVKNMGKEGFEETLGSYIIKPPGKPVLVVESDPREALNSTASAKADFQENLKTKEVI